VNRRTAHRGNGVGRADVNFVPWSHKLAGHVDENRAGVEFNGRPCASARKIFFPDLKAAQLSNRYGRFSAEENARQGFLSSIDYVADGDTVLDTKRHRGGQSRPGKLRLTLDPGDYTRRWLLGIKQSGHEQKS
jgi:hypothetical protein